MTLNELQSGERAVITKVRGRGAFRKRITDMGFVRGQDVEVIKNAPLKDPIEYRIMGYNITLRRSEANLIEVLSPEELKDHNKDHHCDEVPQGRRHALLPGRNRARNRDDCDSEKPRRKGFRARRSGFRGFGRILQQRVNTIHIALVGNPNCGKTTLFNQIAGTRERVGNYAGVTVGVKNASITYGKYTFDIADLPGTYSITEYSPEELFVRNYIFQDKPDIILNIVDGTNLERNMYLTTQLIDMDVPVVMALNMFDELSEKGDIVDYEKLGSLIGIPIVPTVGSTGEGLDELLKTMINVFEERDSASRHIHINYGHDIENAIENIQAHIKEPCNYKLTDTISSRFLSIKLLESDSETIKLIEESCKNCNDIIETARKERARLESHLAEDSETLIADARYAFIAGGLKETCKRNRNNGKSLSDRIDNIVTHRMLGFPIFLAFMWITFSLTFSLGQYPMGWIDSGMGMLSEYVSSIMAEGILKELIIHGILAGIGGVIIFLPNILILFFMISLMEDSGYMARSAFIMDKLMHKIGLHGKSFIPMIMGFGCNVPAIMATRTIESRRDRLLTMMLIPFMSCSARLPVFILLIGAFFSAWSGTMLFIIYFTGILVAILTSLLMKNTLFKKSDIPFVMELPPYRRPHLKTSITHMWEKGAEYLKKIGGIILISSVIIWALGRFPLKIDYDTDYAREKSIIEQHYPDKGAMASMTDKEKEKILQEKKERLHMLNKQKENERLQKSYIGRIGKSLEPVFEPLGFNWKMGVSLITGLAAKEIVVSTLGVLYQVDDADDNTTKLGEKLKDNSAGDGVTPLKAISFILFILLYLPCFGAIAAIKKESGGWKWPIIITAYTTGVAWLVSFLVYNIGRLII